MKPQGEEVNLLFVTPYDDETNEKSKARLLQSLDDGLVIKNVLSSIQEECQKFASELFEQLVSKTKRSVEIYAMSHPSLRDLSDHHHSSLNTCYCDDMADLNQRHQEQGEAAWHFILASILHSNRMGVERKGLTICIISHYFELLDDCLLPIIRKDKKWKIKDRTEYEGTIKELLICPRKKV